MFQRSLSSVRWLRRLLVAAAAVGTWSSAQAITYHGVWDPPFGSDFSDLNWSGDAYYDVPAACEAIGATYGFVFNASCAPQAVITSAQVTLTNRITNATTTLVFNPASMHIFALDYTGANLTDLWTDNSNYIDPATTLDGAFNWNTEFSLFFDLGGPHLLWRECSTSSYYDGPTVTTNSTHNSPPPPPRCSYGVNDSRNFPPEFTITRVPEPGTLALACLGLLGLAPRRVRAALAARRA